VFGKNCAYAHSSEHPFYNSLKKAEDMIDYYFNLQKAKMGKLSPELEVIGEILHPDPNKSNSPKHKKKKKKSVKKKKKIEN